jgi:hypothetical protein
VDVARWLRRRSKVPTNAVVEARIVKRANKQLEKAA